MTAHDLHAVCPHCRCENDAVSGIDTDNRPKPQDITICIRCGNVSMFDELLMLRKIDVDELGDRRLSATVAAARQAWTELMLRDACDACRMDYWIEREFTRCCGKCKRHVVPHRGCLMR